LSYTLGIHADPPSSPLCAASSLMRTPSLPGANGSTPAGALGTTLHAVSGVTVSVSAASTRKTTPFLANSPWPSHPGAVVLPPAPELMPPLRRAASSSGRKCGLCGSDHVWLQLQWSYWPAQRPCDMGRPRRKWYSAVLWLHGDEGDPPPDQGDDEDPPPRYEAVEPHPRPVRRYVSRREGDDRSSYAATIALNSWSASGDALCLPFLLDEEEEEEDEAAAARRSGW